MKTTDWKDALGALMPEGFAPEPEQQPKAEPAPLPKLKVEIDRKRAGKIATIISGFEPDDPRAEELAATLKRKLAVGGSARGGEILLQGDRMQQAIDLLRALGYKASKNS